ncbi:Colicin V production protein [hydrothermal vent metagenome]|uniref:Colicin V production protein n=1 Tax=hydrothermal vent metagenome TaxID=652676 RepID=A0A3B0V531_9ZZZZ
MNWLDFVFIGIISLSVIISLFRGLIREVLSLLIWVGAFWVAYNFVDVGANTLSSWIELPSARHLIAFVALFLAALIVGGMINFIVAKLITKTGLSGSDRFFGMFFGGLRGLLVVILITFFVQATPLSKDPWWQQSKLAPHFTKISEWVRVKMPDEFSNYFSFIENSKSLKAEEVIKDLTPDPQTTDSEQQMPSEKDTPEEN